MVGGAIDILNLFLYVVFVEEKALGLYDFWLEIKNFFVYISETIAVVLFLFLVVF